MKTSLLQRVLLGSALALVALIAWVADPQGYSLSGRRWTNTPVQYYVNPKSIYVSTTAAVSAVQLAAKGWSDQSRANIELRYAGTTSGSSLIYNQKNEVFFRNGSNGSRVAETYSWWDSSERLLDSDIVFYEGAYKFFAGSGCSGGIYVENVAIHEFGHLLALGHSSVSGATMAPSMVGYCDRTWLTLAGDDISAIESLYKPASGSGSLTTNTAPSVSITKPANNATLPAGTITFAGSAADTQDGNLTANLKWTSSLAGLIGYGATFSKTLAAGTHVIKATVSDSAGLTGSRQLTLTVTTGSSVSTPKLTAVGYKVQGHRKADLKWSGFTSATVDVYRNGFLRARRTNTGAMTDSIQNPGSYTYKLCGTGTSICSNKATVTF